jgi:hypothetical protein
MMMIIPLLSQWQRFEVPSLYDDDYDNDDDDDDDDDNDNDDDDDDDNTSSFSMAAIRSASFASSTSCEYN